MKTYVFDFDGVILKNENIANKINKLSNEFTFKSLHVTPKKSRELQTTYLHRLGHTSKVCHYFDKSLSDTEWLQHYNSYVFSKENLTMLNSFLTDDDIYHINRLYEIKYSYDYEYVLFSNANFIWINNILSQSNINSHLFFDDVFCSDNNYLKPDDESYMNVENVYPEHKVFIDDNITNLKNRRGWTCHHHCPKNSDEDLYNLLL